jgi:hypothetical protein
MLERGQNATTDCVVVETKALTRKFGNFTAVDGVSLK